MSNAGQAVGAIAGGAIGFFVGGPTGALYGFQIGLLVGTVLSPTQLPGIEGPRLEDFETIQTDPGSPVFVGWGVFVVPGFRMYLGESVEGTNTEQVGGKGPPEQELTSFIYTQTLALGLCEGPIVGISRVWENGELVYDARPIQDGEYADEYDARLAIAGIYAATFVLYLGTETQLADPTIELEQGAGNVPGFRGLAYIVYPDRLLKSSQANRHPQFKIEIDASVLPILFVLADPVDSNSTDEAIIVSRDNGITWTGLTTPMGDGYLAAAYSPIRSEVLFLGSAGNIVRTVDGITVSVLTNDLPADASWGDMIWHEDFELYVVCSQIYGYATPFATSPTGEAWTLHAGPGASRLYTRMLIANDGAILVGSSDGGNTQPVARSVDGGATWAFTGSFGFAEQVYDLAQSTDGVYMFCNRGGSYTNRTADLSTYTQHLEIYPVSMCYEPQTNLFVASTNETEPAGILTCGTGQDDTWILRTAGDEDYMWVEDLIPLASGGVIGIRPIEGTVATTHLIVRSATVVSGWTSIAPAALSPTAFYNRIYEYRWTPSS